MVNHKPPTQRLPQSLSSSRQAVALDTQAVRDSERVDYWREMVLRLFADVQIAAPAEPNFHGSMHSNLTDVMRLTHVAAAPQSVQRLHRDARESYEDCYFAVLMLSGKQRMQQDNRQVEIQAGDFAIYDGARPHRLDFDQEWSELVLSIPRPTLNRLVPGMNNLTSRKLASGSSSGEVLRNFLQSVATNLPRLSEKELASLSFHALNMIGSTLTLDHPLDESSMGAREVALLRAKMLIDANLGDPCLDTNRIARRLGLSARYLNRLFNSEQTSLMRYVWNLRLDRCRDELMRLGPGQHRVLDIALRWGFSDMSHFSRAFKLRFGISPRDCRAAN
jgi:AraC-like DNA-binding protein/mannose-6-phosphate isomerase-like protein (cupin superfamily)